MSKGGRLFLFTKKEKQVRYHNLFTQIPEIFLTSTVCWLRKKKITIGSLANEGLRITVGRGHSKG
jgi:hypothetical protein